MRDDNLTRRFTPDEMATARGILAVAKAREDVRGMMDASPEGDYPDAELDGALDILIAAVRADEKARCEAGVWRLQGNHPDENEILDRAMEAIRNA